MNESDEPEEFKFVGLKMLTIGYKTEVVYCDHYLARDDPYSVVRGDLSNFSMDGEKLPKEATHYFLGKERTEESVSYGKNKQGDSRDYIPIVFLKK